MHIRWSNMSEGGAYRESRDYPAFHSPMNSASKLCVSDDASLSLMEGIQAL